MQPKLCIIGIKLLYDISMAPIKSALPIVDLEVACFVREAHKNCNTVKTLASESLTMNFLKTISIGLKVLIFLNFKVWMISIKNHMSMEVFRGLIFFMQNFQKRDIDALKGTLFIMP